MKGLEAIKDLNDLGISNMELVELDVSNTDSIKSAEKELESKIDALDVLINNAGISGGQPQNLSSIKIEDLRKVFDINFFGALQTTQE